MSKNAPFISVVIPVFLAQESIKPLTQKIIENILLISPDYEIILVNDGSPDESWEIIYKLSKSNSRIIGINLSRNFGQHPAIFCGLSHSKGKWVIVMDCDFQDNPDDIATLYNKSLDGFDVVLAKRITRNQPLFKKVFSAIFYKILSYMTGIHFDGSIGNYGIYSRKVVAAALSLNEYYKTFSFTAYWVGFKRGFLTVEHHRRQQGKSTYTFKKLAILAENIILTFSNKPLTLTIRLGFIMSLISFLISLYYAFSYFIGAIEVPGFTSLILSIWFLSGVIIFCLGLIGSYLGKVFDTVKGRPQYIVSEVVNMDKV